MRNGLSNVLRDVDSSTHVDDWIFANIPRIRETVVRYGTMVVCVSQQYDRIVGGRTL